MQLHPRTLKVQEAGAKIGLEILRVAEEYDLTMAELLHCVLGCTQHYAVQILRAERHPESPGQKSD